MVAALVHNENWVEVRVVRVAFQGLALASITVGQSQGFQVTLLIFPHDELAMRTMSAVPDLSVPSAPLFNIATADFLVVPGTAQPKKFAWRR